MRILFLSNWFPYPADNGATLRAYHLLRALTHAHEVSLVSFAFGTAQPDEPGDLRSLCADIQAVPLDPFEVNRAGIVRTFVSLAPIASRPIPVMSQRVTEALAAKMFDAVVASNEMVANYALQALPNTAKILDEHNSMTRWMQERYLEQTHPLQQARCWVSWQKTRRYEARLFDRFDLVTVVSVQDQVASRVLAGYQGRVEVVPNGVDCRQRRPGLAEPQPGRLVFNGSLTYSANYDAMQWFLLQVYPRIRAQVPGVSLTITGSIKGVDLTGLALDDSVRLTGFVEDVRIPVTEAAVCVAPIRQGGGTRLKILEAMALGTPVVATTKGAEGLDVLDGEHLLLAKNAQQFAAQVLRLLADDQLAIYLRRNARQLVEHRYDWDAIGQGFVALVKETVTQHRALSPALF